MLYENNTAKPFGGSGRAHERPQDGSWPVAEALPYGGAWEKSKNTLSS